MKKSKYLLEIQYDDTMILYNTLYGSVIALDKNNQIKYNKIVNGEEDNWVEDTSFLLEQKIIEKDCNETSDICIDISKANKVLQITIFVTTACNMQCVYCFEHLTSFFSPRQNVESIIAFIKERYKKTAFEELDITWFGGEPLLDTEYICELSKKMIAFAFQHHIQYQAKMVTNGILLTKQVAYEMKNICQINNFQITIDGVKEEHNRRRPFGNKDGFSLIMNNIKETCSDVQIVLRINVDKSNENSLEMLLQYLAQIKNVKERVYLYLGKVIGDSPTCMSYSEFEPINTNFHRLIKKYGFIYTLSKFSLQGNLLNCGALYDNSFVIYPNGDLYKCYEVAGNKEYCIGNICNFKSTYKNKIKDDFHINEKCKDCNKLPICNNNICPYRYNSQTAECIVSDEYIRNVIQTML